MKIGYARVSTTDQNLELQTDALKQAGCEKIVSDRGVSGAKTERPGLDKALNQLRKGDILVIWKLDRLGRSLSHLLSIIEDLKQKGVDFASVQDGFDTSTASGKMVFSVIGAMAEYERNLIRERTMAGLTAARARGRMGGRPQALDKGQVKVAVALAEAGELTINEICEQVGCSRSTYYRQVAPQLKKMNEQGHTSGLSQSEIALVGFDPYDPKYPESSHLVACIESARELASQGKRLHWLQIRKKAQKDSGLPIKCYYISPPGMYAGKSIIPLIRQIFADAKKAQVGRVTG